MQIENGLVSPLHGFGAEVYVRDAQGFVRSDLFVITNPNLSNLNNAGGAGTIAGGTTSTVSWQIVPTANAAVNGQTEYFVSGTMYYQDGGQQLNIPLSPVRITVYPQPELELNYFLQRDVISDDPHTEEIESAEPFTLAVLVNNKGAGAARNLRIESAQPKIIENEKGLLIDFEITGTSVNGAAVDRSLIAQFGNVGPGEIAIAEWQMEASLQGLFVEYEAKFEHLSGLGDNRLSLIKSVEIHELIHVVDAQNGGEDLPDFLVNDLPDPSDLPDTLYVSDGSVVDVGLGSGASFDAAPTLADLQVAVAANMPVGWAYLKLDDPSNGQFKLVGIRRANGSLLPAKNFWQTDRTFIGGGQRPILENKVHVLDLDSTGQYTFIYSNGDVTGPTVVDIGGAVPNPTPSAVDTIDISFSELISSSTFDVADVTLLKNGVAVALGSNVQINPLAGTNYRIAGLAGLTGQDAVYELIIDATGLTDLVGNPGVGSESFTWVKGEAAPAIVEFQGLPSGLRNSAPTSVDVLFTEPIDLSSFTASDVMLWRDGTVVDVSQAVISQVGSSTYRIGNMAGLLAVDGAYRLQVDSAGVRDLNSGTSGIGTRTATWTLDTLAPVVVDVLDIVTDPRNIVVQRIDVEFSEPIDLSTLDVADMTLTRGSDPTNLLSGETRLTFEHRFDNVYRIQGINWVQAFIANPQIANFTFTLHGAGVQDAAGNAGSGSATASWTIDLDKPQPITDLHMSAFNGLVQNGQVPSKQAQVSGTLAESGLTIVVRDMTTGTDLIRQTIPGTTFTLPITFPSLGQHRLRVRQIDLAGNTTDDFIENLFVQETLPFIESTSGLPSGPKRTALDTFTVTFVTPVDASQVLPSALRLTRNGGSNLINAGVSVTPQAGGRTFVFSGLSGVTASDGRYELSVLLSQIVSANGIAGSGAYLHTWKMDSSAPTSSLSPLSLRQSLSTFALTVSGTDPAISATVPGSGIAAYDIYVAVDQNPFELWRTLPGEQPTVEFTGDANRLYSFRTVARDLAGNVENKPNQVDAFTYVPDLIPPVTSVTNVDTALSRFKIEFSGTDIGRDLKTFDVFVQIDGGEAQRIARVNASAADANGFYRGTAEYQALTDGIPHTYRIFTLGIDGSQNVEEAPGESKGIVVTASYDEPTPPTTIDLDVQQGAESRSYVRYLDVNLHHATLASELAATLNDTNLVNDRIRLVRFETDGSGTGEAIDLSGYVTAIDQSLAFDFGPLGLGGTPRSNQVDGYYRLSLDLDGDGAFDKDLHFFRLLGDVEGDGDVDVFDQLLIRRAMGQFGSDLPADADGDESVNSLDLRLVALNNGNQIDTSLPLDD